MSRIQTLYSGTSLENIKACARVRYDRIYFYKDFQANYDFRQIYFSPSLTEAADYAVSKHVFDGRSPVVIEGKMSAQLGPSLSWGTPFPMDKLWLPKPEIKISTYEYLINLDQSESEEILSFFEEASILDVLAEIGWVPLIAPDLV